MWTCKVDACYVLGKRVYFFPAFQTLNNSNSELYKLFQFAMGMIWISSAWKYSANRVLWSTELTEAA